MCKKLFLFVLVLGMASASYSSAIVGNWETAGTTEGWSYIGGSYSVPGTVTWHTQPIGVTLGDWDTKWVENTINHGKNYVFKCEDYLTGATFTVADWQANDKLEFDLTRVAGDWTGTNSTRVNKVYVCVQAGGYSWSSDILVDTFDASSTAGTVHLVADYSAYKALCPTPSYVKIGIKTESSGWITGGTYYMDAVKLVPEPATVCLLGLGALGLLRKRRA